MANILSAAEIQVALFLDPDFDSDELERLSAVATSFIKTKTGFDFASEATVEPLAKQAAIMYVRTLMYSNEQKNYNKEFDYSVGLVGIIQDLQTIAETKGEV